MAVGVITGCSNDIDAPVEYPSTDLITINPTIGDVENVSRANAPWGAIINNDNLKDLSPSLSVLIRHQKYEVIFNGNGNITGYDYNSGYQGNYQGILPTKYYQGFLNRHADGKWGFHDTNNDFDSKNAYNVYWPYHIDGNHSIVDYSGYNWVSELQFFVMGNLPDKEQVKFHVDCPYYDYAAEQPADCVGSGTNLKIHRDLLYGKMVKQTKPEGENVPVNITLKHAMAKLRFEFVNNSPNTVIDIENVAVFNVYSNATMSIGYNQNDGVRWHTYSEPMHSYYGHGNNFMQMLNLRYDEAGVFRSPKFLESGEVLANNGVLDESYWGKELYHLVIPQNPQSTNAAIRLWMRVTTEAGHELKPFGEFKIPITEPSVWEEGKCYTYRIVFNDWDRYEIDVDCSVADWTTEEEWVIPVN